MFHLSHFVIHISCVVFRVLYSCVMFHLSHFVIHISCVVFRVSCFMCRVSCVVFHSSHHTHRTPCSTGDGLFLGPCGVHLRHPVRGHRAHDRRGGDVAAEPVRELHLREEGAGRHGGVQRVRVERLQHLRRARAPVVRPDVLREPWGVLFRTRVCTPHTTRLTTCTTRTGQPPCRPSRSSPRSSSSPRRWARSCSSSSGCGSGSASSRGCSSSPRTSSSSCTRSWTCTAASSRSDALTACACVCGVTPPAHVAWQRGAAWW